MKIVFVACQENTWKQDLEKKRNSPPNKEGEFHEAKGEGPCNAMKKLTAFVGHNGVGEFRVKEPSKSAF